MQRIQIVMQKKTKVDKIDMTFFHIWEFWILWSSLIPNFQRKFKLKNF